VGQGDVGGLGEHGWVWGMWMGLGTMDGSGKCGWVRGSWVVQGDEGGCDSQGIGALLCGCIIS